MVSREEARKAERAKLKKIREGQQATTTPIKTTPATTRIGPREAELQKEAQDIQRLQKTPGRPTQGFDPSDPNVLTTDERIAQQQDQQFREEQARLAGPTGPGAPTDVRAPPGAPLQDPRSGAGGKAGALGFTPSAVTSRSEGLNFELGSISQREEAALNAARTGGGEAVKGDLSSVEADIKQRFQNQREAAITKAGIEQQDEITARETGLRKQQESFTGQQQSEQAQQTSESVGALSDEALLNQVLGYLPDSPVGQSMGAALRNSLQTEQEIENFQGRVLGARQASAEDLFADIENRLAVQTGRAQKTFNEVEGKYEQSLDSKNKLFAQQQANDLSELKYLEEKQTRDARKALRKQIDSNTVVMALMGRAGSVSANNELTQAEFDGEQAILDLQREIGFKRADVRAFYTGKFIEAQDTMTNAWYSAKDKLDNELGRIETQGITNSQLRQRTIDNAFDTFVDEYTNSRREGARLIAEAAKEVNDFTIEESKARQDAAISTGDTLDFISGLTKEVNNRQIVKDSSQIAVRAQIMQRAAQEWFSGKTTTAVAVDQALITMFNKMTDPSSVVRESEYLRTSSDLSLFERIKGQGAKQFITGGAGLTDDVRRDLVRMGAAFKEEYDKQLDSTLQPYLARVNRFNSQNVANPVNLTDILPSDLIPALPEATIDMWSSQMKGEQTSLGAEEALPGFLSPENAPAKGYRTDRHNNPTAFTIGIAKQAGLKEGVDYEIGDSFDGGTTARLLGDPIETTIRVIDKIGFHTKKGGKRWTHTAMSKKSWNALTLDQKSNVVSQMYQREGGTGELIDQTPIQVAGRPTFDIVPTAQL